MIFYDILQKRNSKIILHYHLSPELYRMWLVAECHRLFIKTEMDVDCGSTELTIDPSRLISDLGSFVTSLIGTFDLGT